MNYNDDNKPFIKVNLINPCKLISVKEILNQYDFYNGIYNQKIIDAVEEQIKEILIGKNK